MLCKTTMRAALAHVLGTVGIVGAFGAGAAPDNPYAAESLTGTAPYEIMGSPMGEIVLDVEIDTLLDTGTYFLAVNFWTAELTGELGLTYTETAPDTAGTAGSPVGSDVDPLVMLAQPKVGKGTGFRFYTVTESVQGNPNSTPPITAVDGSISSPTAAPNSDVALTRAYRGDEEETGGAYRMVVAEGGIPIDTRLRLDLSDNLAIRSKAAGSYRGDVYIYEELGDARAAVRASAPGDVPDNHLFAGYNALFRVATKIAAPTITPMLVTADVGYERDGDPENNVSTGGPFRGFSPPSTNVGVLATITLNEKMDVMGTPADEGAFLAAATGLAFEGTVNTAARVVVTSTVDGAFGFGNDAGEKERRRTGDNPDTPAVETDYLLNAGGAPSAFRVGAVGASCGGTPLVLSAPNADGDQVSINPLADTNPTFSAMANQGAATVSGGGPFQLCVNVSTNEVAIPAVGDDRMMDGYMMTVTPMSGPSTGRSAGPAASGAAGSIDRNGTTVNIAYLSTNLAYNQRLVIVNRGSRDADFWMDDFQTEEGVSITGEISGTVMAGTRMVVRVQDVLDSSDEIGAPRASGTLNLTAREGAVSVMTIQENLGTGQLDTTMY